MSKKLNVYRSKGGTFVAAKNDEQASKVFNKRLHTEFDNRLFTIVPGVKAKGEPRVL